MLAKKRRHEMFRITLTLNNAARCGRIHASRDRQADAGEKRHVATKTSNVFRSQSDQELVERACVRKKKGNKTVLLRKG